MIMEENKEGKRKTKKLQQQISEPWYILIFKQSETPF